MVTQIITRPVEIDGQHWVSVNMDGHEMERRGPFPDADAAEAMAARLGAICRGLFTAIGRCAPTPAAPRKRRHALDNGGSTVSNVVDLRGRSIPLEDDELIENLARFADGTLSEAAVKSRHHLSNEDWAALGESDKLVELVEACKLRRIRSGATKRERAQIEIVDAPPILGGIMRDPNANERHRIDSIKTLDALASTGAEAAAAGARFEITINLGADHIEHYSKSIAIDPDDTDPNDIDTTDVIAAITMNKPKDDGDGQDIFEEVECGTAAADRRGDQTAAAQGQKTQKPS